MSGADIVAARGGAVGRGAPGLWRVFRGRARDRLTIIGTVGARLRELPDLCPKFFDMGDRRGLVRGVLFGDALNDPEASVAVTIPTRLIPPIIKATATTRPVPVTGDRSPYPTVVTVVIDHQTASPNVAILASGCGRSISRIASDAA